MNTRKKHKTTNQTFAYLIESVDRLDYVAMGQDQEQDEMMREWEGTIGDGLNEEEW